MAAIDLSDYTFGELKGLLFDVERELKQRKKEHMQQEVRRARERIEAIAREAGIDPAGLAED